MMNRRADRAWRTVWLAPLLLLGCAVPVAADLDEPGANRVVVVLESRGVVSDKEADPTAEGRWRVMVARDDASAAITALTQESLPTPESPGVLESIGQGGLVPSRSSEHARLVAGTAGELERSLRQVDGVLGVRVHLAVTSADPLDIGGTPEPPSASVLLRHRGATPPIAPEEVQRLVAGAVPKLEVARVAVVATSVPAPPQSPERELARFGPVTTTRSSLLPLRAGVGVAILLNLSLFALLWFVAMQLRRTRAELEQARAQGPAE